MESTVFLVLLFVCFPMTLAQNPPIPQTLGWYQLPNTTLRSVCPSPTDYPDIQAVLGCTAVTAAWSGGALDTKRNYLIMWGGGHNDYAGNEVYALDLNTLTVKRLNEPTPTVRDGCVNEGTYADGNPVSRHTYNHLAYLPDQDVLFAWGGSQYQCGYFIADTWFFNLSSLRWTRKSSLNGPSSGFGRCIVYDPNHKLVYAHDDLNFYSYDPLSDKWTKRTTMDVSTSDYKVAVIDPVRKRYLFCTTSEPNTLYWYDISSATSNVTRQTATTVGCDFMSTDAAGFEYDPVQDRIVAWIGGDAVYLLNPNTFECTTVSYPGGPTATSTGTYGRFRYYPPLNIFVVCNSVDSNCYILRLTNGSLPSTSTSTSSPSPSLSPSPSTPTSTPTTSSPTSPLSSSSRVPVSAILMTTPNGMLLMMSLVIAILLQRYFVELGYLD
jgi:hypothetical protein